VPAFASDLASLVPYLHAFRQPAYLRLGSDEAPADFAVPPYSAWRQVLRGDGPAMVVVGPLAGSILAAARQMDQSHRPSIWVLTELPIAEIPAAFLTDIVRSGHLFVAEEHVNTGSAGQALVSHLITRGIPLRRFTHHVAQGYVSGRYGSQKFHRKECGLDAASIVAALMEVQPC
jgi:transketolase